MGWVSLFDPQKLAELLSIPTGAKPVAIICLGHVDRFYPKPMLELEGWEERRDLDKLMFVDRWSQSGNDEEAVCQVGVLKGETGSR